MLLNLSLGAGIVSAVICLATNNNFLKGHALSEHLRDVLPLGPAICALAWRGLEASITDSQHNLDKLKRLYLSVANLDGIPSNVAL